MSLMKNGYVGALGTAIGVLIVAALTVVALGAQQGPPPGRGPGGQGGRPGMGGRGPGGPGGGPMGMLVPFGRELNLTDAQKEQFKALAETNKDAHAAIAKRMQTARQALNEAVLGTAVDESLIRAKAAEVAAVEVDAALERAKLHAQAFALLTPEQQAKAKQLLASRPPRGEGPMGGMRGRGMGGRGRGMGGPGRGMGGPGRGIGNWL